MSDKVLVSDLDLETVEERLRDVKDTREYLNDNKWTKSTGINEKQFDDNTKYSLGILDNFEKELNKRKKEIKGEQNE